MEKKIGFLSARDWLHGLFITVAGAVIDIVIQTIQNGGLAFTREDVSRVVSVAVIAGLSYLSKKLLSDEQGNIGGKF